MKVLVADDDATSRIMVEAALNRLNYDIVVVNDGAKAWAILCDDQPPQLAVLDWSMPEIDGVELCKRIRERATGRYTYIVLITSRTSHQDAIMGLNAGADDFITKPFNVDELRARLSAGERMISLEMQLQRSRSYLAEVLANIDSGVMLSDANDDIIFANPALEQLYNCAKGDVVGRQRTEFLEDHARYFTKPRPLSITDQNDPNAESSIDFEVGGPSRKVMRWTHKNVPLVDGEGQLDVFRDVTSELELARVLTEQALTDSLTSLMNRRGGQLGIDREHSRRTRGTSKHLSFALLDIDHFKTVNDTHGHLIGDRVLQAFAEYISAAIRQSDIAIRWGGEEILVVLPDVPLGMALVLIERLRAGVAALPADGMPHVTVSAGVSELRDGETSKQAIDRADAKLYEAKSAGRNCVK